MQTLGISDSTPRTESRLKSLFWPSIQTGSDVDYLGAQGYWVCTVVSVLSFVFLVVSGQPISGIFVLLFYYLGGVGVRERSRYAATVVLLAYVGDTLETGLGVLRVLIGALLLSNLRATWIASRWKPASEEAILPPRLSETWADKLADRLPMWLWPKVRIAYYVFSVCFLVVLALGLAIILRRRG
ncbi:MAG: hypothetical protein LAO09_11025 [Acidobacteriia bacterium]|nr:hypothetical protein [Terriglobia bacterium]